LETMSATFMANASTSACSRIKDLFTGFVLPCFGLGFDLL
jgi:hypothetical protein